MARRSGRKGDYLGTDSYTGFTHYASELRRDFWGNHAKKPLLRNLQEIATPLADPYPVTIMNGPTYEITTACSAEIAPSFVGLTNVPTNTNNMAIQVLNLAPRIPNMSVGCTFQVS